MKTIKVTEEVHNILEKIKDKIRKKVGKTTFSDAILYLYELEKEIEGSVEDE